MKTTAELLLEEWGKDRPWVLDDDGPDDFNNWLVERDLEMEDYLRRYYKGI